MYYFRSFILLIFILSCGKLSAQLSLDLSQSESVCSSDGSITATASDGTSPYQYQIVSGPNLRGFQTSGTFLALQPGDYTLEVRDASFTTASRSIKVEGDYILPNLSVSFTRPTCSSNADGQVVLNGSNGNLIGTPAFPNYKYRIVDLSTTPQTIVLEQNTDTFSGLAEGTYTFQIEDGCQNTVSETVNLMAPLVTELDGTIKFIKKVACDTYEANYDSNGDGVYPHEITVTEDITGAVLFSGTQNDNTDIFIGMNYNFETDYTASIVDACGQTQSIAFNIVPDINVGREKDSDCSGNTTFTASPSRTNSSFIQDIILVPATLTITNRANPADEIIYSITDPDNLRVAIPESDIHPGETYDFVLEDDCGYLITRRYTFNPLPATVFTANVIPERGCMDGTAGMSFSTVQGQQDYIQATITSGPPNFTSENGTVTNYIYPRIYQRNASSIFPVGFPPGLYEVEITDGCETAVVDFEISPSDTVEHDFTLDFLQGCGNSNSLVINPNVIKASGTSYYTNVNITNLDTGSLIFRRNLLSFTEGTPVTIPNLPSGNYQLDLEFQSAGNCSSDLPFTCPCEPQTVNVTIPTYATTSFESIFGYTCTEGSGVIFAEGMNGVTPYQYEIINSSISSNIGRTSNDGVFTATDEGTYTIRITDSCGNSADDAFEVTPYLPDLVATCDASGNVVTIMANPVPNATFTFIDDSGITLQQGSSNELVFNPFEPSQAGEYVLQVDAPSLSCAIYNGSITVPEVPCSPSIDVSKTVESGPTFDSATGTYTVGYRITADNAGGRAGSYDLTDTFDLGTGITLTGATLTYGGEGDGIDGTILSPFNSGDQIITNESLAGLRTESWLVTATFSVDQNSVDTTQDCSNGGGFGNAITVAVDTDTSNNTACIPLEIANLNITKDGSYVDTNGNGLTDIGDEVVYTFVVTNAGNTSLSNVMVSDPLLGGTIPGPASGDLDSDVELDTTETWSYTASYAITQAEIDNGQVNNLATVSAEEPSGNILTETSTDPTPCTTCTPDPACTDCTLTELQSNPSIDGEKIVESGPIYDSTTDEYTVTYRITVTNIGDLTGSYDLTDTFRLGTGITLTGATLAYGGEGDGTDGTILNSFTSGEEIIMNESIAGLNMESWLVTATFSIDLNSFDPTRDCSNGGGLGNEITVTGDTDTSNNTACAPLEFQNVDITKDGSYVDADGNGLTTAGDQVIYTFLVTNTGSVDLSNVIVSDPLLGGTISGPASGDTDSDGELDTTETWSYNASYAITQIDIDNGQVDNLATVSAEEPNGNILSETSTDPTPCTTCTPDPDCTDCTLTELPTDFDISLGKVVDISTVVIGDEVNFTITATNNSSRTTSNIVISEILPDGLEYSEHSTSNGSYWNSSGLWEIAVLNADEVAELYIKAVVVEGTEYLNTAFMVGLDQDDINPFNDIASAEVFVEEPTCPINIFNAVTANGDGFNDFFRIECLENYPDNRLQIYNRWGVKVFDQNRYDNSWNGNSTGRVTIGQDNRLPVGTYFYILNLGDGQNQRTGYLYLTL